MKARDFDKLATPAVAEVLEPHGFEAVSKRPTFARWVSEDVVHVVMLDPSRHGHQYDVRVFPHSPLITPDWSRRFPDSLGFSTDMYSSLNPRTGIGPDQHWFPSETAAEFESSFPSLRKALLDHALPYLDGIGTLDDLANAIPQIERSYVKGVALHAAGRHGEAAPLLQLALQRYRGIVDPEPEILELVDWLDQRLKISTAAS